MTKGLWKKGWFWGVAGTILILTIPPLVLALLGFEPNGKSSDGKNIRVWAISFFYASNHVEIHDHSPPAVSPKKEEPPEEEK